MSIRITKPWLPLVPEEVSLLGGQMGVYQLGDEAGNVIYIGVAGGRSLFGLRGEMETHLAALDHTASNTESSTENSAAPGALFRVEITSAYRTRQLELLMVHQADHGTLPIHNDGPETYRLGRLSPA